MAPTKNQLIAKDGITQLYYEPLGRLTQQWNGGDILDHDGSELVAEWYGGSPNTMLRRHVHRPGVDEPIVTYEGSGTKQRRFLAADERGSIVSVTDSAGALLRINTYDEYGIPASGNLGRFQYTGQA